MNPEWFRNDFRIKYCVDITPKWLSLKLTAHKYSLFLIIIQLIVPVTCTFLKPEQVRQSGRIR